MKSSSGSKKPSMRRTREEAAEDHRERDRGACESEDDSSILVMIDPKVLHCSICKKPLQSPVSQCVDGHTVCFPCSKDNKNCNLCSFTSSPLFIYRGFDAILQSIKVTCPHAYFGCKETISYTRKHIHEESCPHAPCSCPIPDCIFKGSAQILSAHLQSEHSSYEQTTFFYNRGFKILMKRDEPFRILHGNYGADLFLLVNRQDVPSGNSLSMLCIRANSVELDVQCELTVLDATKRNSLILKASPVITKEWKRVDPIKPFLFVPTDFPPAIDNGSSQSFAVDVRVKKI